MGDVRLEFMRKKSRILLGTAGDKLVLYSDRSTGETDVFCKSSKLTGYKEKSGTLLRRRPRLKLVCFTNADLKTFLFTFFPESVTSTRFTVAVYSERVRFKIVSTVKKAIRLIEKKRDTDTIRLETNYTAL